MICQSQIQILLGGVSGCCLVWTWDWIHSLTPEAAETFWRRWHLKIEALKERRVPQVDSIAQIMAWSRKGQANSCSMWLLLPDPWGVKKYVRNLHCSLSLGAQRDIPAHLRSRKKGCHVCCLQPAGSGSCPLGVSGCCLGWESQGRWWLSPHPASS